MTPVQQIRHRNFTKLVDRFGTQVAIAELLEMNTQQVSHLYTGAKGMGEKLASRIESKLQLEPGSLSNPNSHIAASEESVVARHPNKHNSFESQYSTDDRLIDLERQLKITQDFVSLLNTTISESSKVQEATSKKIDALGRIIFMVAVAGFETNSDFRKKMIDQIGKLLRRPDLTNEDSRLYLDSLHQLALGDSQVTPDMLRSWMHAVKSPGTDSSDDEPDR